MLNLRRTRLAFVVLGAALLPAISKASIITLTATSVSQPRSVPGVVWAGVTYSGLAIPFRATATIDASTPSSDGSEPFFEHYVDPAGTISLTASLPSGDQTITLEGVSVLVKSSESLSFPFQQIELQAQSPGLGSADLLVTITFSIGPITLTDNSLAGVFLLNGLPYPSPEGPVGVYDLSGQSQDGSDFGSRLSFNSLVTAAEVSVPEPMSFVPALACGILLRRRRGGSHA